MIFKLAQVSDALAKESLTDQLIKLRRCDIRSFPNQESGYIWLRVGRVELTLPLQVNFSILSNYPYVTLN